MKECRYCEKSYPESYFGVALTTKNKIYYRHKCKYCYQNAKNVLKRKYIDTLNEYKKANKCSICGNGDYRVLDFHHKNKDEKSFSVSFGKDNRFGLEKMMKEIKKCAILCANCHRIEHWQVGKN